MRSAGLLLLTVTFGQDLPQDPAVVIRSTTSLVQVRVVAEDAAGNAVTGLRREDFQVLDNRKPQPIALFAAEGGTQTGSQSAAAGAPAGVQKANEYSLILLDWLNTSYPDRYQSQQLVLKLLKNYQPRQKVAVYMLGHDRTQAKPTASTGLVHEFTTDMLELAETVEAAGLDPSDMGPDSAPGRFDARFGAKAGPRPSVEEQLFFLNNRINDSFQTLEMIANRLARLPGRKSLIWISAAFPVLVNGSVIPGASQAEAVYYQNMERLLGRLNRADVAVYPVDAKGLSVTARSYAGTMRMLSERTGGVTFTDRNDIDEGVRLALEDMRVSYVLGFHVPSGAAPGLHEIRVKLKRPGVKLRYRESYELADVR